MAPGYFSVHCQFMERDNIDISSRVKEAPRKRLVIKKKENNAVHITKNKIINCNKTFNKT